MRRLTDVLLISISLLLLTTGCGSSSQEITIEPWELLLVNLESAWNNQDMALLESCFRNDFEHHLLSEDWFDYDGDGTFDIYWGLDIELDFAESAFNDADSIFFSLSGGTAYTWPDDSTGVSIAITRDMTRNIYFPNYTLLESEQVMFVCRPDSEDDWYIQYWFDQGEWK